jgi:hypothetical protein
MNLGNARCNSKNNPLKLFNSRLLKEMLEPKRNEITEEWLELLHYLCILPFIIDQIKENVWAGHITLEGGEVGAYRILVRKPEEMRPLGKT